MSDQRKIIHIDMDAFYAAVEQRDFPEYRGKPIVVGGSPRGRGVVATASYEARRFGIHSAMPASQAQRLCPQAIFLKPRFDVYRQVSQKIRAVMQRYSKYIEPLSLDEAYLDVSDSDQFQGSATLLAQDIQRSIFTVTQLTASAGVSYNKFLAKLASDINKPNGIYVITPDQGAAFVEQLPIGKFHGIGQSTEAKMNALGIYTGADLKAWPLDQLLRQFGKVGRYYYNISRGIDERPVQTQRIRKSVSSETTFERDLDNVQELLAQLEKLAAEVAEYLKARQLRAQTLTIKVKYADFQQITRSLTVAQPFASFADMQPLLPELLARTAAGQRAVRLLGVGVSKLMPASAVSSSERQLALF